MVIFGVNCIVVKQGGHDTYGEKIAGARHPEKCAVVKLESIQTKTTVRVDSGATRGGAEESTAAAVLLLKPNSKVEIDDTIEMPGSGLVLRVMKKRFRYNVVGRLDHFQIEASIEG